MKYQFFSLLTATILCVNLAYSQVNQSVTTEKTGEIVAPSREMQTLALAGQLAKFGYENNSATALVQAAELYMSVNTQEFQPVSSDRGEGEVTEKDAFVSLNPVQILADAKILADGDPVILAMIAKAETTRPTRGAVGGPKIGEFRVQAESTDTYTVRFFANERATVIVSGDGDTDLDLYVFDENGNLIAKDDDYSDDCIVHWFPRVTADFIIKVVNRGNVWNHYIIATN